MQRRNTPSDLFMNALWLLLIGIGIGWLTGLSVSPVVSIVITSIAGSAASFVATLSGLDDKPVEATNISKRQRFGWQVNALPLMMLVIGISSGAIIGITARNHHWFGSTVSAEIAQWTTAGIAESEVADRLFKQRYPSSIYTMPYTQTLSWIGGDLSTEVKRWTDVGLTKEEAARLLFAVEYPTSNGGSNPANLPTKMTEQFGTLLYTAAIHSECESLLPLVAKGDYDNLQIELRTAGILSWRALPTIVTDTQQLAQIVEQVLCSDTSS